jgi:hypothetical protein
MKFSFYYSLCHPKPYPGFISGLIQYSHPEPCPEFISGLIQDLNSEDRDSGSSLE